MTEYEYSFSGSGIFRVIQESVASKKEVSFVEEHTKEGKIVRVGYFFCVEGKKLEDHEVIWFDPSEVVCSVVSKSSRDFEKARLDIEFTHPRPNERHFLISLYQSPNFKVLLRNKFLLKGKAVTEFVIQVELQIVKGGKEERFHPVRYDCAHGVIHRDMAYRNGKEDKHIRLGTQIPREAISMAMEELKLNFNTWLQKLGYPLLSENSITQIAFIREMDKAKTRLVDLIDDPQKMDVFKSSFVQFKGAADIELDVPFDKS